MTFVQLKIGRMIPDFEVLDSKIVSALKKLLTSDFKTRVCMEGQKGTTGQSIPERKTNCYMIYDYLKISGTGASTIRQESS